MHLIYTALREPSTHASDFDVIGVVEQCWISTGPELFGLCEQII